LGIGAAVRALGREWDVAGLRRSDGSFVVRYSADEFAEVFGEPTIAAHRGELQSLLVDRLGADRVHTGMRLMAIEVPPHERVRMRFDNEQRTTADLVVGADGTRSTVRRRRFGIDALRSRHYVSWRGAAPQPPGRDWRETAGETWGPGGRFGIIPISNSRITWYAAANVVEPSGHDEVQRRFGDWHHPIPDVIAATPSEDVWC